MRLYVDSLFALLVTGVLAGFLLFGHKRNRMLVTSLIALMLTAVLASILIHQHESRIVESRHRRVRDSLLALHEKAALIGALAVKSNSAADPFATEISPVWFRNEGLPMNIMVSGRHPWIDIAPAADEAVHPPDPVILRQEQAGFWYNPSNGIFRARVSSQDSERATRDLYNKLNGTALLELPTSSDPTRTPKPLFPPIDDAVTEAALTQVYEQDPQPPKNRVLVRPTRRSER